MWWLCVTVSQKNKQNLHTEKYVSKDTLTLSLSPSLPVCAYHNNNLLKEVGSKAPSNLLHHLHSNTNHNKSTCSAGRSCAEAAGCPTCCRIRYSNAACLFTALLAGCHVNRPFQRVCVCSALKNIVRSSVRYVTPRYWRCITYISVQISTAVRHPFFVGTELPMGRVTVFTMIRLPEPKRVLSNSPHSWIRDFV